MRILILIFIFLFPLSKSSKIVFYNINASRGLSKKTTSIHKDKIQSVIDAYNRDSYYYILEFHCYELEIKDTAIVLDIILKHEKIDKLKLNRFVNRENNSLSKNWEYTFIRKKRNKTIVTKDLIYLSADSSFIGVVKLKNIEIR